MGRFIPEIGYVEGFGESIIGPEGSYTEGKILPTAANDQYDVTDGVQKVVTAPGILTNDTYTCD